MINFKDKNKLTYKALQSMKVKKKIIVFSILIILVGIAFYPFAETPSISYIDRQSGEIETEKVAGEKWLVWLYTNPIGELSLHSLVKRKFVSSYYGRMMDSPKSVDKIESFVNEYTIDLSITKKQDFLSFNDFFIRELKDDARPIDEDSTIVTSPADGKIMAYAAIDEQDFIVKGYKFDVPAFLNDSALAEKYSDGSMIIVRLCPTDYHRYHFPVSGEISSVTKIDGDYYSVNPIAVKKIIEIFCINKREFVTVSTREFGDVIMAEIGATMVGSIVQTYQSNSAIKGKEKGYFKFGGSSVVLLFEKGKVRIDEDLLKNTKNNLETEIKMGEKIAVGFLFGKYLATLGNG
jgi:phosphatidylserine decarboxylase